MQRAIRNISWIHLVAAAVVCFVFVTDARADESTLFSETFGSPPCNQILQSPDWFGKAGASVPLSGFVTTDPQDPNNCVLTFASLAAAGDTFSKLLTATPSQTYVLEFDYLGDPNQGGTPANLGGTVGISEGFPGGHRWLVGTATLSGSGIEQAPLADDGNWRRYNIPFDPFQAGGFSYLGTGSFHLMLEDFSGSGGVAGDVYFDNIAVSSRDPLAGCSLALTESRITDSSAIDTTPTLGSDPLLGNLVVYTSQEIGPNGILPGLIRVQFLTPDGAPSGSVLTVSDGLTNDRLNDVHGNNIVYTAYDTTLNQQGRIVLHDLSMGTTTELFETATQVRQARIHDNVVVWVQGVITEAEIYYFDLRWLGTGRGPQSIAGGSPAALNVEIGENFIVWNTHLGVGGTSDVMAIDRLDPALADPAGVPAQITVANSADVHEQNPSTSGDWIVWETRAAGATTRSTHALNAVTGERRVIQDVGTSRNPSIDGDLVAYEGNAGESGHFDIYVYRLSTGETTQITNDPRDQLLNNIHGAHVAYVDNRTSFADVFVTALNAICPDIDVAPMTVNFGDVEVGSTETAFVTISNVGVSELTVSDIILQLQADYAITTAPALPAVILAGGFVDVTVTFTPLAVGARPTDFLEIISDDPDESPVSVPLNGTGVAITVPPSQQIADIIMVIEDGIITGSITPEGPGNSGPGRLGALINMIGAADDLIADGLIADACQQLLDAFKRTDGLSGRGNPPDFISGADAALVASLIQDLRTDLGCP